MKPQKLKYSATWWQITKGSLLLGSTNQKTKKACIKEFLINALAISFSAEPNVINREWRAYLAKGYNCVEVTAFWKVTK